jgi:hypothetical protein
MDWGRTVSGSIIPFLDGGAVFDEAATRAMGMAYDDMLLALNDRGQPHVVKEALAKRIIAIAKTGERDPDKIYKRALAAFGFDREIS